MGPRIEFKREKGDLSLSLLVGVERTSMSHSRENKGIKGDISQVYPIIIDDKKHGHHVGYKIDISHHYR